MTRITFLLLLLIPPTLSSRDLTANPHDHYCGTSWPDAFENCHLPCPDQQDSECSELGEEYACFGYTGCKAKLDVVDEDEGEEEEKGTGAEVIMEEGQDVVSANKYCGTSWIDAMKTCDTQCGADDSCPPGTSCQLATNCHVPLIRLKSLMMVTMNGPDRVMGTSENDVFGGTMNDIIGEAASGVGLNLNGVDVGEQTLATRRNMYNSWGERYLNSRVYNVTQRFLPSGSSALDVSMVVTGDYRPPPYLDLDVIAEDSINRGGARVVSTLKERGSRAGSQFFERVSGIEAVAREAITPRPTKTPTAKPTRRPSGPPTPTPSMEPSSFPSSEPSLEPTRTIYNTIMTGSQQDLLLGGSTTSSFGFMFNMRTKPEAGVTLITGLDFYTHATEEVSFSLYTRVGSFLDYKGSLDGWDVIASGAIKGRGVGRYTAIPDEMFTPVDIVGGGGEAGTRAFYLRMTTNNLVYQISEGQFSDKAVQVETPDVEVWEGEAVLSRNLPDPNDPMAYIFFRFPRRFLGAIYYDRVPCKPFDAYGRIDELPCPNLPTASPSLPQPSLSPVTNPPSRSPVSKAPVTPAPFIGTFAPISPTAIPTSSPTLSRFPSTSPSTTPPSGSPVVPMQVHLNVNLRNVPERPMTEREYEKFLELMVKFLDRYTESNMAISGISIWHQQLVFVDAPLNTTSDDTETNISPNKKSRKVLEQEKKDQIIAYKKKQKEQAVPQTTAMQITLILKISFSFLPQDLLAKLAVLTIQENEVELMAMLQEQSAFYTYFKPLDGITSDVVLELTPQPTPQPTTLAYFLANQEVELVEEEETGYGFGAQIGLGIGFLWFSLTCCSILYVMRARTSLQEQRDLENLLKQEKSTPIGDSDTSSDQSSASVPVGDEEEQVSLSTAAELSILERKKAEHETAAKQNIVSAVEIVEEKNGYEQPSVSVRSSSKPQTQIKSSIRKSMRHGTSADSVRGSNLRGSNRGSMRKSLRDSMKSSNSVQSSDKPRRASSQHDRTASCPPGSMRASGISHRGKSMEPSSSSSRPRHGSMKSSVRKSQTSSNVRGPPEKSSDGVMA